MAWSLVASASAQNTTSGIDTTGATLIILSVGQSIVGSTTPSDSKSNTWTALTKSNTASGDAGTRIYYCISPTVGTGHTFSAGLSYTVVSVHAFSGNDAAPYDTENTNGTASGSTMPTGSVTPANNGSLLIAAAGLGGTTSGTAIDSSFTGLVNVEGASGITYGGAQAYLVQSTAASINPAWSITGGGTSNFAAAIAVFKVAAGGGGASGTAAVTLGNDTSSATGTTTVKGSAAVTLQNATSTTTGTTTVTGTVAVTLQNATSSASGTVGSVTGTVAVTLAGATSSGQGTTTVVGTAAITLANATSTASGAVGSAITGTAAITLNGDASSAQGTTKILGTVAVTLSGAVSAASGNTQILGSATITLGNDFSTAFGTVGTPATVASPRGLTIRIGLAL